MVSLGPLPPCDPETGRDLRPGWLASDEDWKVYLDAMTEDDVCWAESQWQLAGGHEPRRDMSWLKMERIRG